MRPYIVLTFGAGIVLAALMRPSAVVTVITSIVRIPVGLVNATAGLRDIPQKAK